MTKELLEKCKPYEMQFKWAIRSNFIHMTHKDFSVIASLYKEAYGTALTKNQMTCNTCRLNALKKLGEDYFNAVQEIAIEEKEERLNNDEAPKEEKKKKGGRKPKIDID